MENSRATYVSFYRMMKNPLIVHEFCLSAIQRAAEVHGLDWRSPVDIEASSTAEGACPLTPADCLSQVHDTGMVDILFARRCFRIFLSSFPQVDHLVHHLTDSPDTTVSCIGDTGPSLEYLAFLTELREYLGQGGVPVSSVVKEMNVIKWLEEWRYLTNALISVMAEGMHLRMSYSGVPKVVWFHADKAICQSGPKREVKEAISKSSVVLMMDLREDYSRNISEVKALFDSLKRECLVFYSGEPATVDLIDEEVLQETPGKYLQTPTKVSVEVDLPGNENGSGMRTLRANVKTAKNGTFFVWQKLAADDVEATRTSTERPDKKTANPNFRTIDTHIDRVVDAVAGLRRTVEGVKDASE